MSTSHNGAVAADPPAGVPVAGEPAGDPTTASSLRASDAERTATVERLHGALGAGRLDLAETDDRVAAAYAARYRHELTPLLADLPTTEVTFGEAPSWAALWALAVWRMRMFVFADARGAARPTPPQLRTAAVLTALATGWFLVCAVLGAVVVAA